MKKISKDIYMYVLGTVIVIGFFTTLVFLIVDGSYKTEVNMIVGALIATFTMVVSYFYGSSKGSADKDAIIQNQNNPTP